MVILYSYCTRLLVVSYWDGCFLVSFNNNNNNNSQVEFVKIMEESIAFGQEVLIKVSEWDGCGIYINKTKTKFSNKIIMYQHTYYY